ncbi:MAG: aldehyde dehydrogenase [Erysipelotrichia bacterium]|jgi:aldehyde dehydrogenase (NAD+)|nr:aldehyde dehydrogenase [Bacilli bacterium]MDD4005617.1 aldehyde dehydrogenase [Bacilli bacterium]NMV82012.1 aldehyde dehydrogenase [Erysipelotrichia bacterium]
MIEEIVQKQRDYYFEGHTRSLQVRRDTLKKLRKVLLDMHDEIYKAFMLDFNKCEFDVISTEYSLVIQEIDYMLRHLRGFMKPKRVATSLVNVISSGYIYKEPYGVTLVMSPWNYPLQLSMVPVVASLASGNTVVLKPSKYAWNISLVLQKIASNFDPRLFSVVVGGREENQALLNQKFDFIFFTGGDDVGRVVLEKASQHLTPVVLELGGKSPCVVTNDADIDLAAKRITWGKYLNAGQTCVAPDHVYVHESVKDKFISKVIGYIQNFYYQNGTITDDFPSIINDKHVERLVGLIDSSKVVFGGHVNKERRLIEPTIMDNVNLDDAIMKEEIFGPIMPILSFTSIDALIEEFKTQEKPLAFYLFTSNGKEAKRIMDLVSFGGGCINDTIMHLTNDRLPFGGVGRSGMGSYHGKKSFDTFTHEKSVLKKAKIELPLKYPPYTIGKMKFIKWFFKIK